MPYLPLPAQRLFYTHKSGSRGLPALVLVHGAGNDHQVWPVDVRYLPAYAVYALDLPGHGRSTPPGRRTVTAYADDVAAFIQALKLPTAVIVGHSMGGAVAQMMALRHPQRVAGLVLIGTGAHLPVSDAILNGALTDFTATVDFITRYSWARGAPAALVAEDHQRLAQTDPQVLHDDFVACHEFNVMDRLPFIHVPTLVIAGEVDKMTPPTFSHFLATHIPQAELVTIAGAGHKMMWEQPAQVSAAISVFLRTAFPPHLPGTGFQ